MKTDATRLADSLRVLLRLFTIDETRFPSAGGRMRYNPVDFQSLHYIGEHSGCRAIDVASFLGLVPTTVQSALDRLEQRGLIERATNPDNRRAVSLQLTAVGMEMQSAIAAQDAINCAAMLGTLPSARRARFLVDVEQMASSLADMQKDKAA